MNKNWLRYLSLLLFLALQCFLLLGILLATRVNTDAVLKGHTEEVMSHVVSSVSSRTRALLEPAESSVLFSHALLQTEQINAFDNASLEKYFISQLQTYKQFSGMYLGRPDGSFVFVNRDTSFTSPEGISSSYRTKIIQTERRRTVELIYLDSQGSFLARSFDSEDMYDPRTRPWYALAHSNLEQNSAKSTIWTKPYIFFSSLQPGITAASAITSPTGESIGTIGVDIQLSDLSMYLDMFASEQNDSFAFLQTTDNVLIAFPEFESYLRTEERRVLPDITHIDNPVSEAFLTVQASKDSTNEASKLTDFKVDKVPYIGTLQPISIIEGQEWLLGVHAPRTTYTGNITARYQRSIWNVLLLGLLFSVFAIPLCFGISRPLQRLHRQATTDGLTGLNDRSEFIRQAKQLETKARRSKKTLAYIMMDLDNFKPINDIYGHNTGDEVLTIIARRLKEAVKAEDLVARFGGDEFALCLYDVDAKNLRTAVERVRLAIESDGVRTTQGLHQIGITAGAILSSVGKKPEQSLAFADNALVQGKVTRKGRSYISDGTMNASKIIQNRDNLNRVEVLSPINQKEDAATDEAASSNI